jgi:hypothetical protein
MAGVMFVALMVAPLTLGSDNWMICIMGGIVTIASAAGLFYLSNQRGMKKRRRRKNHHSRSYKAA